MASGVVWIDNESKIQEPRSGKHGSLDSVWFGKKSEFDNWRVAIESVGLLQRRTGDTLERRRSHDDFVERVAIHRSARTHLGRACWVNSGRRINSALALVGNGWAI